MANFIEDLVSRPEMTRLLQTPIEDARKRDEWETVGIDATYKITMSVLGQRKHGTAGDGEGKFAACHTQRGGNR